MTPGLASKPTIAVDVDDVLAAEAEFIVDFSNKRWGHSLSLEDYREHWAHMWEVDHDEVERRADILHAPGMVSSYRILDNVHEALKKLSRNYNLIIITSRRKKVESETKEWIKENFADVFSEIYFTGFWDDKNVDAHLLTKADLSRNLGVDYLIDDQPKHCLGAAKVGISSILFGDYAESRHVDLPDGVVRCKNWQEVLEYFDEKG